MQDNEDWAKLGTVSWKRLCTMLFLVLVTIQLVVLVFYHDAMYSPLNLEAHPKRAFHNEMLKNAVQYVDHLPSGTLSDVLFNATTTSVQIAIIIPTTQRKQRYLDVCLWSLFEYNSPASFESTTLTLINTARSGEVSNVDLDRWRKKLTTTKKEWPLPIQILNATAGTDDTSWYRRGVMDYVQSLKECIRQEASWCLILEEDVVLRRNFLSTFRKAVVANKRMSLKRTRRKKIGMVKVFVSDYWDGFSYSWVHVRDVVLVGIFALLFLVVLFRCCLMPARAPIVRQRNRGGARRKCFSSYVASVLGFYLIWRSMGRQALLNVLELPRGIHLDPIGKTAGAVGIVYPATALTALCDYLDKQLLTSGQDISPIDVALNEWMKASSFKALRTRPSLVQHMGLYSSAGKKNQGNMNVMKQDSAFTF